jgi:hypothetical protein
MAHIRSLIMTNAQLSKRSNADTDLKKCIAFGVAMVWPLSLLALAILDTGRGRQAAAAGAGLCLNALR